ncbi:MAG: biotin/lipoyl-binding protein [Candidatus Omnitrophica bacterium]|nr:biotin/lipoyl-binding protein [Candidatus Omnitrophota bacterium]
MFEIKLPELSNGATAATVTIWHYTEGDSVRDNDDLVEFITDESIFHLSSPVSGRVKRIIVDEGEVAMAGDTLAVIE